MLSQICCVQQVTVGAGGDTLVSIEELEGSGFADISGEKIRPMS